MKRSEVIEAIAEISQYYYHNPPDGKWEDVAEQVLKHLEEIGMLPPQWTVPMHDCYKDMYPDTSITYGNKWEPENETG